MEANPNYQLVKHYFDMPIAQANHLRALNRVLTINNITFLTKS